MFEYMGIANMAEIPARKSRAKASRKGVLVSIVLLEARVI